MTLNSQLLEQIQIHNIEVVENHDPVINPNDFLEFVKNLENQEGFVITWQDGHKVKCKSSWYLRLHKVKDSLSQEKNVIEMLLTESIDDAKAFMMDEDRKRVEEFEDKFWNGVEAVAKLFEEYYQKLQAAGIDRKTYALEHMKVDNSYNQYSSAIIFGLYNGKDALKSIIEIISKNTGTQTRVDEVRILWGNNIRWNYHFDDA